MKTDTLLKQLFDLKSHFGHQKKFRQPALKPFIYKTINGIDIINLEHTVAQINSAKEIIKNYPAEDILIISNRTGFIKNSNTSVIPKWKPGMLTNFKFGSLVKKPELLIVDRAEKNSILLKEAQRCNVKSICLCDTNSSLFNVGQLVVINDDSDMVINFVIDYLLK